MLPVTQKEINRLQDNLQIIRLAVGWSLSEFGEILGVSKQTVSNLDNLDRNKRTKMSEMVV